MAEWKELTDGLFKSFRFHVAIPVGDNRDGAVSRETSQSRRLQVIRRALVDGAKINDFGGNEKTHTAEVHFFGKNYLRRFNEFEKILNEGTPGILILPDKEKAVIAFYSEMTDSANASEGSSLVVNITWIEEADNERATQARVSRAALRKELADAKRDLDIEVENASNILTDNPFLDAIRKFESGLSTARSFANAVLTLSQGVRDRIKSIDANIKGTLALIGEASNEIEKIFSGDEETGATPVISPVDEGDFVDFTDPDIIIDEIDPIIPPSPELTLDLQVENIKSESSLESFIEKIKASLASDRDQIEKDTSGRTSDVSESLTEVINSLSDLLNSVVIKETRKVVTPFDMSLLEVMFFNGVSLDQLREVHKRNTNFSDILIIPKGAIVEL